MSDPAASFNPLVIIGALGRNYVAYVLIGGLAQVLRGADIVTTGMDICPSFAKGNLERLNAAIGELAAGARVRNPLDEHALSETPVTRLSTDAGELQVIGSPAGIPNGYVDLRRAAAREDLGHGVRPLVVGRRDRGAQDCGAAQELSEPRSRSSTATSSRSCRRLASGRSRN